MSLPLRPLSDLQLEAEKLGVDISERQLDTLLSSIELLVTGEILPCMSSPVRISLLRAAVKGRLDSTADARAHAGRISYPAISQHLKLLSDTGLIRQEYQTVRPTELTALFYPAFEPFFGSLAVFSEKHASRMRCSILSRLALACRDGVPRVSLSLLAKHCGVRESTMSKHLKQLRAVGMVDGGRQKKWGTPFTISAKGKAFVDLVFGTFDSFGKLMLQVMTRSSTPRLIAFSTSDSENVHLISFVDKHVSLELACRFHTLLRIVPV